MRTTLTSKGQMTLPTAVRTQLGLEAGDQLMVSIVDADTILLKRRSGAPLSVLRGMLGRPSRALTVEEMDRGVATHLGKKHDPRGRRK